ncbi:MAG: hypothetical protein AAFR93_11430 [Pseudomonadota bacterium]
MSTRAKLLRFVGVGAGFSLGYAALTSALVAQGAPAFWTSVLVYAACIPLAFWAQKAFAFRSTGLRRGAMGIYAATQVASLAAVSAVTTSFVTQTWWLDTVLFAATAGAAALVSFAIGLFVTFKPKG